MKRLLAAGSGSIYQICKVFRGGELGRLHNPEFTLLEWYRLGFDHHNLMDEVEALVRECLPSSTRAGPARRMRYREAFESWAGVDPFSASPEALARCLERHGIGATVGLECSDRDAWLDLILTQIVEPRLQDEGWVFLYDYPPSQASLARVRAGNPPVAERFELYVDGIELANGFHELGDATEQRRRFEADLAQRRDRGLPVPPKDECLLAALEHGLPDCAGVALGVDRLVMVAAGAGALRDVMAFPIERA
jgi:lysyl-tRNA synthetase class 2